MTGDQADSVRPVGIWGSRTVLRLTKWLMLLIKALEDIACSASNLPEGCGYLAKLKILYKRYLGPILTQLAYAVILLRLRPPQRWCYTPKSRRLTSHSEVSRFELDQALPYPMWRNLNENVIRQLESTSIDEICCRVHTANVESPEALQFNFVS